jgi:ABC-2 type transport system permease protein
MNQFYAAYNRSLKEFLRDKAIIGSTYGMPLLFLLIVPTVFFGDVPKEIMPIFKGMNTLAQITLTVMIVGQSNLSGSIVADRERGLYRKISSLPLNPVKEVLGRVFASVVFSLIGIMFLFLIGLIYGAEFSFNIFDLIIAIFFLLLIFIASAGIGLIISSIINGESAATHIGIGLSMVIFFIGIGLPYTQLPSELQVLSKINPLTAAYATILYLLEGYEMLGYNPLNFAQITSTITLSSMLFGIGLYFYKNIAWKKR